MHIAVLGYDRISPFMLSTPIAVFGEPFLKGDHRVSICSSETRLSTTGGIAIETKVSLQAARDADIVILPGWRSADEPVSSDIIAALQSAAERGAIVVGLCLGAFGLAEAGLLDGRRATTHWAKADTFAARYPKIDVDPGALFIDEGPILTSAGVASGIDCCLHLLARVSGQTQANRVARHLVVAPQRAGRQSQLLERPTIGSSADRKISEILEALRADPSRTPSLDELAALAGMSRRTLSRHIRARVGGSLGDWLRHVRIERAQEILLSGARGFDGIATRSGFPDAHALRNAFRSELGLTPIQWLAGQRLG